MKSVNYKVKALAVALALVTFMLFASTSPRVKRAEAATPYAVDKVTGFYGSLSGTTAVVMTATDSQIVVKGMTLSTPTATTIQFTDGSGGTPLFSCYLEANKQIVVTQAQLGGGFKTTSATALYAYLPGAAITVNITFVYNRE